jgi:gluconate 5-dehydrogenase
VNASQTHAGKIALVTGASRGLGFEIAHGLGRAGCHVVLHGRDRASLDAAVRDFATDGLSATAFAVDLEDEISLARELSGLVLLHPRIDILVNNAGARDRRPLEQIDRGMFRRLLEVNLVAPHDLVRRIVPHMPAGGRIINITSIAGPIARSGDAAYTAAKGGLAALTHALAAELGARGITVNAVAPGYFATDTNRNMVDDPETAAHLARRTSLGRWGEPKEIAGAVVFLSSPEASYITGTTIAVDGGYLVHF